MDNSDVIHTNISDALTESYSSLTRSESTLTLSSNQDSIIAEIENTAQDLIKTKSDYIILENELIRKNEDIVKLKETLALRDANEFAIKMSAFERKFENLRNDYERKFELNKREIEHLLNYKIYTTNYEMAKQLELIDETSDSNNYEHVSHSELNDTQSLDDESTISIYSTSSDFIVAPIRAKLSAIEESVKDMQNDRKNSKELKMLFDKYVENTNKNLTNAERKLETIKTRIDKNESYFHIRVMEFMFILLSAFLMSFIVYTNHSNDSIIHLNATDTQNNETFLRQYENEFRKYKRELEMTKIELENTKQWQSMIEKTLGITAEKLHQFIEQKQLHESMANIEHENTKRMIENKLKLIENNINSINDQINISIPVKTNDLIQLAYRDVSIVIITIIVIIAIIANRLRCRYLFDKFNANVNSIKKEFKAHKSDIKKELIAHKSDIKLIKFKTGIDLFGIVKYEFDRNTKDYVPVTKKVDGNTSIGSLASFSYEEIPQGWVKANGSEHNSRDGSYENLFRVISTRFGNKEYNTFNLPTYTDTSAHGFMFIKVS